MSIVDQKYDEALDQMSGPQRVQRTLSIYGSMYRIIAHQVQKESPELSPHDLKRRVAQRMYLTDSAVQELLRRVK